MAYRLKHWLKIIRWRMRREAAAWRWGAGSLQSLPRVLGNAMPKSGSHLINQVLHGLPKLGPFVNSGFPPVNRSENNHKLPEAAILKNIAFMRPGDIAYGYLKAREPFLTALSQTGRATIFVYRDPRDMIISHVFYATQMHTGHGMHRYYTEVLHSMEERINAAIQGVREPGYELASIRQKYEGYMGWLEQPAVLCLRFEELILQRQATLNRILDYLESRGFVPRLARAESVEILEGSIIPNKSGTFRKGKPGNWQEHFTESNKVLFKELAGDLLVKLGYEEDHLW